MKAGKNTRRRTGRELMRQKALTRLSRLALEGVSSASLKEEAAHAVVENLEVDRCGIMSLLSANRLILDAGVGWSAGWVGHATMVVRAVDRVLGPEPVSFAASDMSMFEDCEFLKGVSSGAVASIREAEAPFGIIGAYSLKPRSFTAEELEFLGELGRVLGAAVGRNQREEAMQRDREFAEAIFDSIDFAMCVLSPDDFTILKANRAFLSPLRIDKESAVIGQKCYEVTHRTTKSCNIDHDACPYLETRRTGESAYAEHVHYDADNRKIYCEITTLPIKDEDGSVRQVIHIARDVTRSSRMEEALWFITQGVASAVGDDFFRSLVRHLALALDVRFAVVCRRMDSPDPKAFVLACWTGNDYCENYEQSLTGTPCEEVWKDNHGYHFIPCNLQKLYPLDKQLRSMNAESYLGVPILNSRNKIIGHLAVLDEKAMKEEFPLLSVLKIFAVRAGVEMERMKTEVVLRSSLKEKEALLKEIHHRVKNNLQVIYSLLNLQLKRIHDQRMLEILEESQHCIKTMALIHERLYESSDLAGIDFGEYLRHLGNYLFSCYGPRTQGISFEVHGGEFILEIDQAIPCALILNELISNSLKYAFPKGQPGIIRIDLQLRQDWCEIVVADNGVGLPKDFDLAGSKSLGTRLVNTLVRQLGGTIAATGDNGAKFQITFPHVVQHR